jgi:hypothetical protein
MESKMRPLPLVLACCLLLSAGVASAGAPAHYAGFGLRGLFRDPTSAVIAGKAKLLDISAIDFGEASLSLRPKLMIGLDLELRLPLTFELALTPRLSPFVGAGAAFNTDGYGYLDHMISGGTDIALSDTLTLSITMNKIFQRRVPDRDSELIVTLNLKL